MYTYVITVYRRHAIHDNDMLFRTEELPSDKWKVVYDTLCEVFPKVNYRIIVNKWHKFGKDIL